MRTHIHAMNKRTIVLRVQPLTIADAGPFKRKTAKADITRIPTISIRVHSLPQKNADCCYIVLGII